MHNEKLKEKKLRETCEAWSRYRNVSENQRLFSRCLPWTANLSCGILGGKESRIFERVWLIPYPFSQPKPVMFCSNRQTCPLKVSRTVLKIDLCLFSAERCSNTSPMERYSAYKVKCVTVRLTSDGTPQNEGGDWVLAEEPNYVIMKQTAHF